MISIKSSLSRHRPAPDPAPDDRAIGDAARDAAQWAEAATAYCRYLDANPGDAAIWIQAGNCFKEAGNFARSLTAYRKAEQLEPNSFEVHLQLGHLYKVTGNLAAALAAYERAAALDPDFGEIRHEIVEIADKMKASGPSSDVVLNLFGSIDELLDALRALPRDKDPFVSYFKSVGGYTIDRSR